MPRIPVLDAPQVASRPIGTPFSSTHADSGFGDLARGVQQLGQGVQQAHDIATERADEVQVNEGLASYVHTRNGTFYGDPDAAKKAESVTGQWGLDLTDGTQNEQMPHGFFATKGKAAVGGSQQALEALDKRRKEIADGMTPAQREKFLSRSAMLHEESIKAVEMHVGQQVQEAEVAAQKALVEATLTTVSADPRNEDAVQATYDAAAESLRKSALSPEDANGKLADLQSAIAKTRVQTLLADGDWKAAGDVLDKSKGVLGKDAGQLRKAVSDTRLDVESEKTARGIIDLSRPDGGGPVDENQALAAVEAIPPGPERDKVAAKVQHYAALADKEWGNTVDKTYSGAFSTYLKEGTLAAVPEQQKSWLIENAPEKWQALLDRERMDKANAKRAGRGGRGGADRAYALVALKADLAANPERYADPAYTVENFKSEWGVKLNASDLDTAGTLFAATKKEPPEKAAEFSRYVTDQINGIPGLDRNRLARDAYSAQMGDQRRAFLEKNKRTPTPDELDEMHSAAMGKVVKQFLGRDYLNTADTGFRRDDGGTPSAKDRARELRGQGKSNKDIAAILNSEGY